MARPDFHVQVSAVRQLTARVREYLLTSVDGAPLPAYAAGAHVALHMASPERGPIVRHYSLVGGTGLDDDARNTYRIAVQREDHARGSAHVHATFVVGTRLHVGPPVNNFPLDRRDHDVLLIAGGIGITPILSMARSLKRRGRDWRVFYAGREAGGMAYHDELRELCGARAHFHYSDAQGQPNLRELLRGQPEGCSAYVCGPAPMIEATHAAAAELGWAPERVHSEIFTAAIGADAQPFAVHLRRTGKTVQVSRDASVLDALLAEGVPVLWDCRRGECGLCAQNVISAEGGLEHRDRYLSDEEKTAGETMCICVSRACGSNLVLDL